MLQMARQCTICVSANLSEIESALVAGRSLRDVARQFPGVCKDAVSRHKRHMAISLEKVSETRALASASGLIDLVEGLIRELGEVKAQAKQAANAPEVRKSVETILRAVSVLADLTGANAPKVSVQVQAQMPTPEEAIAWSKELLLAMLSPDDMRVFAGQLQDCAGEDRLLVAPVIEGRALDRQPNAPK
jgi:hypothetical protein